MKKAAEPERCDRPAAGAAGDPGGQEGGGERAADAERDGQELHAASLARGA